MLRFPIFTLLFTLLAPVVFAQPAFDVATIKPSPPSSPDASIRSLPGGRYETTNLTMRMLVKWAWDLDDSRLVGAPRWFDDDHFDIAAQSAERNPPRGSFQAMMRSLLTDRFQLKFHNETRELTAYSLVVDKGAPKVQVVDVSGGFAPSPFKMTDAGRVVATKVTAAMLAKVLSEQVKRPVNDATNFTEAFDFTLEWAPESDPESKRPSIFTAVREQLGFRLDSRKTTVDVLVIDQVERTPAAN